MVLCYVIGGYRYVARDDYTYSLFSLNRSDSNFLDALNSVKSYDQSLHQSLDKIFREHCLSRSSLIGQFLRGPQHNTDYNSIIKPILEQEPCLSRHFSKEDLEELSLLWIAVLAGYTNSAELLMRSGADVNELFGSRYPQVIDEKCTVLQLLLQMHPSPKNERLIRLVMDQGADLKARNHKGQTFLHITMKDDRATRVQVAKALLEKGADVNVADDEGMTPLLVAVSNSKAKELVPLLLKHGADVFAKSRNGENVLHRLLAYGSSEEHIVDLAKALIMKGASVDDKEHFDHYQPIHRAAEKGKIELIKLYLDHGVNVNAPTLSGKSPLYLAANPCCFDVVEILIECGANIELRTTKGSTALHAACKWASFAASYFPNDTNNSIIIRLHLSAGADILVEDYDGKTPLAFISYFDYDYGEEPSGKEVRPLIKELAMKKALEPSIELNDERIIERYPNLRDYYRRCTDEIDRMKLTNLIETCSLFDLLVKSECQIAPLTRNPKFEIEYRLYIRGDFPTYAKEIPRAFERAKDHYESLLHQENLINEAVYDSLPYLIVRKIAHYTLHV